jgi:NRPS condensation-like uncharacterized protein
MFQVIFLDSLLGFAYNAGMGERKVFSTRLDQDLIKELKHLAVDEGRALNDLLEEAIQALLKKYKSKSKS